MSKINLECKFCNNQIPLQVKLSAEDYMDEHAGELENMQGGVLFDQTYQPKKDRGDFDLMWFNKKNKNYPGKKDVPAFEEDDIGMPSLIASFDENQIILKCDKCKSIAIYDMNDDNIKISSGITTPEANDTYHSDNYLGFGETGPIGYGNETHEDFNKVISTPETGKTELIKKKRLKPYVKNK